MSRPFLFLVALGITTLAAAAPPADTAERAADKRDKMICKRFLETGSLVRGYRTCKTKAEWDRDRADFSQRATPGSNCATPDAAKSC